MAQVVPTLKLYRAVTIPKQNKRQRGQAETCNTSAAAACSGLTPFFVVPHEVPHPRTRLPVPSRRRHVCGPRLHRRGGGRNSPRSRAEPTTVGLGLGRVCSRLCPFRDSLRC